MDNYLKFKELVKEAADKFKSIDKSETVRIISHLDCDGICACSILVKLLNLENMKYSISIVQQLNDSVLRELQVEGYKTYIFCDLGSGHLSTIENMFKDKNIFVLDHHEVENYKSERINFVSPHLAGIDGSREISGSGVVFNFALEVNKEIEDMAHVAVIGAIGDIQESGGFSKLNNEILEIAVRKNKINVKKGLRVFGGNTRPVHKLLEYSTDPYIPDVSGSESGAIQFLQQIGINPKIGNDWKKLSQLTQEEQKKLAAEIIMKRANEENPEDIFGNLYELVNEKEDSPLREAKEFSTLLNSCGRMSKASLGIGTCLGHDTIKLRAIRNLADYKREIVRGMNWYNENKDKNDRIMKKDGYMIINAKEDVLHTIIGTIASIITKSNGVRPNTFVLSMAQNPDNDTTKVSLRIAGDRKDINLKQLVETMCSSIEGAESGGHMQAAGAVIPSNKEEELIENAKIILERNAMEESID